MPWLHRLLALLAENSAYFRQNRVRRRTLPTQGSVAEPRSGARRLGTYPTTITATRPQPNKPGGAALAGEAVLTARLVAEDRQPCHHGRLCVATLSTDSPGHAWEGREAPQRLLALTVWQFSLHWAPFKLLTST